MKYFIVNHKKGLIPFGILLSALFIALLLIKTKPQATPITSVEKSWVIAVQLADFEDWAPTLTLYGRVESLWSATLTAGITADIKEVKVIEGDTVEKGQQLIVFDDRDVQLLLLQRIADLAEAEAKIQAELVQHEANLELLPREKKLLSLARAEVDRLSNLVKKQVGSQSTLDTARQASERQAILVTQREQAVREHESSLAELKAKYARALALRNQASIELERAAVAAPFDGRIVKLLVSPGKRVRAGDQLIELYDTGSLVFRAQLPNRFVSAVMAAKSKNQELTVTGRIDGEPVKARLLQLAGEVSIGSGGVEALFQIEGDSLALQQGRFVNLNLELPVQDNLIALPHEAIYGVDRIYLVDAGSRMRPVRVERVGEARDQSGETKVLIRSETLKAGDSVVVTQLPNAVDGLLVQVAEAKE